MALNHFRIILVLTGAVSLLMAGRHVIPNIAMVYLWAIAFFLTALLLISSPVPGSRSKRILGWFLLLLTVLGITMMGKEFWKYEGNWNLLLLKQLILVTGAGILMKSQYSCYLISRIRKIGMMFLPFGKISYALYVLHYPILVAFREYFTPKLGAFLSITFALLSIPLLAWIVEVKIYPAIKDQAPGAQLTYPRFKESNTPCRRNSSRFDCAQELCRQKHCSNDFCSASTQCAVHISHYVNYRQPVFRLTNTRRNVTQ